MRRNIYAIGMANIEPITVKQAAKTLDCSEAHVRLLIVKGRIDARRFSRVYLVDAQSVARYLEHGRCPHMGRPRKTRRRKTR